MSTEQEQNKQAPIEEQEGGQQAAENTTNEEQMEETASPIEEMQAKLDEMKDKYLRLYADFDNYKKRMAKERLELTKEAGKDILVNLLPTLDDFERALNAAETATDVSSVKEGMELIHGKLMRNLEQKGLKAMDAKEQPFDAEFHEAITEIPAPTDELKGKVVDVVEQGYYLNDKIIRYAKVVVGK